MVQCMLLKVLFLVLGKMGHSERQGENRFKNVYGEMDQKLFEAGVNYFRGGK